MSKYALAAEAIKERVSMLDAISMYATNPTPRYNRIPCPIHAGKNYNLWFSDWGYHCFVCGSGGDVIHFVQHIFNMSFPDALDKLNSDFQCGAILDRRPTLREQRDAQKRYREIMERRERERAEKEAYEALYNSLWDEWCRMDLNRIEYAPRDTDEPINPLYAEAVTKIDYRSYLIDAFL